jgi:alpha-galactosidase
MNKSIIIPGVLSVMLLASTAGMSADKTKMDTALRSERSGSSSAELKSGAGGILQIIDLPAGGPLFSFMYDGRPSGTLLPTWPRENEVVKLDQSRTKHIIKWRDLKTQLEVRLVAVKYNDFPVVEWTVFIKNTGSADTPLLADIQGIDLSLRDGQGEFVLRTIRGDDCSALSYQPLVMEMHTGEAKKFAPAGGRPSNAAFPYYNIIMSDGGLILAVGWPGQWAASFTCDAEHGLRIVAGQELTHLYLKSGEEIRTPLVALLSWRGTDLQNAQNIWRRWMWTHNVPRTTDGKLPPPILFGNTSLEFNEMCDANEENQKYFIDRYRREGVKLDYWWMDAGWYPCGGQWPNTGTWEPDAKRFPAGLRAISDYAQKQGVKTLVWFEPERVANGTWLSENHPKWLLGGTLLNLGNPDAQKWLTDHVDRTLREQGIALYRQDFNMDPLAYWRKNDPPDRQGITENLHVQGYLAYWDELRRRNPNLVIDSCASGGRRNDLETMRRAVALHPTDYNYTHLAAKQAFHYCLFQWIPYFGSNTLPIDTVDTYAFRSGHGMGVVLGYDLRRKDLDCALLGKLVEQWRAIVPFYYGDYYPLTPYSIDEDQWIAWQFHRPEQDDGAVEAFRRSRSKDVSMRFKLYGLDADAAYELKDLDNDRALKISGRELMQKGFQVELPGRRQAATIIYKRLRTLSAIITASPQTGEVPLTVTYSATGSCDPNGKIVHYAWQFGDGSSAKGLNAKHTYASPGTYVTKLTVKNNKGMTDAADVTIAVTPEDTLPPTVASATANGDADKVVVTFSEPVEQAGSQVVSNYAIDHGIKVSAASLGPDLQTVTLKTSLLSEGITYSLSVYNIKDRAAKPHSVQTNTLKTFKHTSLIAHWKLDDGQGLIANDSSGNALNGTLLSGPTWVDSDIGGTLSFDGVDDYVTTNTYFPDLTLPFSISLWVNPAASQVRYADVLGNHGEPYVGLSIQQDKDNTNLFGFGYGDGKQWQGSGNVQLNANQWQHLAVVCDGTTATLYVDGEKRASGPAANPIASNPAQDFKLGQGYHTGRYFHGLLRDVRIYKRALSSAEITGLAKVNKQ